MLDIFEIPMYVWAIVLLAGILGAHFTVGKTKDGRRVDGPETATLGMQVWVIGATLVGMIGAIVLSLLTAIIFEPEIRQELSSKITVCKREASAVQVSSIDKSMKLPNGANVIVHNVAYNVPQRSMRALETNGYACAKATMVEVTVENIPVENAEEKMSYSDFELYSDSLHVHDKKIDIMNKNSPEKYAVDLIKKGEIDELELRSLPDGVTMSRGWLVFPVSEGSVNESPVLKYVQRGKTLTSITLPSAK